MICVGVTTEVATLKKALAEAEEKAAKEQAARKKLKARLNEAQHVLQDAVKKCDALEGDVSAREPNSPRLAKVRKRPGLKPRVPSRRSRRPRGSRRVRRLVCKASM